jgi:hypothetical protein
VAIEDRLGVAVKAWDGDGSVADVAMVSTLESLGVLSSYARAQLASIARPAVLGGESQVGEVEPRVELQWT